jgi:hypothetical protein
MVRRLLAGAIALLSSACATGPYEWKYGQDKIVPGQFSMTNTDRNGTVLTWPSHAVAAIVYPNGDTACIQSAQSAKARNSSGNGNVSLSLAGGEKVGGALGQAITEAVASIQDRNDVATFLDVALFQICTLARNKNLTADQTIGLIEKALATSEAIAKARPQTTKSGSALIIPNGATVQVKDPAPEPTATASAAAK